MISHSLFFFFCGSWANWFLFLRNTHSLFLKLEFLVFVFLLLRERSKVMNCCVVVIKYCPTTNMITRSSLTGCSPTTPSASPTVLHWWRSVLIGRGTETLPQHKRPKWETKTHSVSYKNSPTVKYAVFLNVQWNVRVSLCTTGSGLWCKCWIQRGVSLRLSVPPHPLQLSVWVCRAWACAQVKGSKPVEDSLLGPIGDPLCHPWLLTPPSPLPSLLPFKTPHTWQELDPLMPALRPSCAVIGLCVHVRLWGVHAPFPLTTLKSDWKHPSGDSTLSYWLPGRAAGSSSAVERWPANCFVLQCWFSLGQGPQSLLEGLRGDDDRCTARLRDKSRTNGMLWQIVKLHLFHHMGRKSSWEPALATCFVFLKFHRVKETWM